MNYCQLQIYIPKRATRIVWYTEVSRPEQLCCGFANDNECKLLNSLLIKPKANELPRMMKSYRSEMI